jgi:cytochrome c biogenesis factor
MWLGAILMGFGGFTTAFDKRYRRHRSGAPAKAAGVQYAS